MSVAFLFPGQGSQSVGMLHELTQHPAVIETLAEASETLDRDVQELDTATELESTVSVQLALLIAGVATARALSSEGLIPEAVAGLSVGAFAAAVQCGALEFRDAIRLVRFRAESMAKLYPTGFGLSAIVGLSERQVSQLVEHNHTSEDPVYLANINTQTQLVIAGSNSGMEKVLAAALMQGARKAQHLAVSVPSHCPLLEPVAASLRLKLTSIRLHSPTALYISNVGARSLRNSTSIAEDLAGNIAHAVRWSDTMSVLEELGCRVFLEMPPGHILRELSRQDHPTVAAIAMEGSKVSDALISSIRMKDR
jgi:malonate decarboxylase epsilon subunit